MAKRHSKLHPDDKVEVISTPEHHDLRKFVGEKGHIVERVSSYRLWRVRFSGGETMCFHRREIKKVEGEVTDERS